MPHSPIFITGGAGFIASHFVRTWIEEQSVPVVNLDALTYAGRALRLVKVADNANSTGDQQLR